MAYTGLLFLETLIISSPPAKDSKKRSSVTKEVISATEPWPPFFKNMGWHTGLLHHTTPKQTTKLRFSRGKSSTHCKR
ncbi:hypothetical protein CR513_52027, partial [Mucuna pruriens]